MLAYKTNLDETLGRLRSFYGRNAEDKIFAAFTLPSPTLELFKQEYEHGFCQYPDPASRIQFWKSLLEERTLLEDDSIPSVYLSEFDQGLYGGMLGAKLEFMAHPENGWISSMVGPLLKDWDEFASLEIQTGHPWFKRYVEVLDLFASKAKDRFGISHFICIDSLNFVFELFGATQTYMSVIECPENVQKAVDFAYRLNTLVQDTFFKHIPLLAGGTCSNMSQWLPGRIISESLDPFHMTSVDYFEEWGRGPVEKIFSHYDGGVVHIHGNGRHLLEAASTLKGLKCMTLLNDRGFPAAFDVIGELKRRVGNTPLAIGTDFESFSAALKAHTLTTGILYVVSSTPDADAAHRCMDKVRAYH